MSANTTPPIPASRGTPPPAPLTPRDAAFLAVGVVLGLTSNSSHTSLNAAAYGWLDQLRRPEVARADPEPAS